MKKTLKEMSAYEVTRHYTQLNTARILRAKADLAVAEEKGSKRLVREAERLVEHAERLAEPRRGWQLAAADERLEKYGVKVAAGFMAANGWSIEVARFRLLGK